MFATNVARVLGIVPLLCLAVLLTAGQTFPKIWWVVAATLGLSFVADAVDLFLPMEWHWWPSLLYPMAQALLLGWVLLNRPNFWRFAGLLTAVLALALVGRAYQMPDDMLRTVSWVGGGLICWDKPMPHVLKMALVITFGLGAVAWVWHMLALTAWPSWYAFQAVRLVGVSVFVGGAVHATAHRVRA